MGKDAELGAGKPGGVHDAGVDQLVENDDVAFVNNCGDGAEGGGVTGGKGQRGLGLLKRGQ